jgi:hypothetical protein
MKISMSIASFAIALGATFVFGSGGSQQCERAHAMPPTSSGCSVIPSTAVCQTGLCSGSAYESAIEGKCVAGDQVCVKTGVSTVVTVHEGTLTCDTAACNCSFAESNPPVTQNLTKDDCNEV